MYEFFSFRNYGSNASLASMHGTPLVAELQGITLENYSLLINVWPSYV
jgi:hypothetical protein